MNNFQSWTQFKESDPEGYRLLKRAGNCNFFDIVHNSLKPEGWYILNNPYFVTEAQWQSIALRVLGYESLREKTLACVIETFYYEVRKLQVGDQTYHVPSGTIFGYMQGMFMCINPDGSINT